MQCGRTLCSALEKRVVVAMVVTTTFLRTVDQRAWLSDAHEVKDGPKGLSRQSNLETVGTDGRATVSSVIRLFYRGGAWIKRPVRRSVRGPASAAGLQLCCRFMSQKVH